MRQMASNLGGRIARFSHLAADERESLRKVRQTPRISRRLLRQ